MPSRSFATSSVVVFDLEYTAWKGSQQHKWSKPGEYREIVQIGAVWLERDTLAEAKSFDRLVSPVLNPRLSDYLIQLTGITQDDLDCHGQPFETAFREFIAFLDGADHVLCNGADEEVLIENCLLRAVERPPANVQFQDIRPLLAELLECSTAAVNSGDLLEILGEKVEGKSHHALSDARAVAAVLRHFRKLGRI